jgi:uncharacterized protein (TIGR04222 family)
MSPFDLRGPEFLVFFLVLSVAAGLLAWFLRWQWDPAPVAGERMEDPYLLAFLCGGRRHLLRVAVLSLIDRELLQAKGDTLRTAGVKCLDKCPRYLDQAILESCLTPAKAGEVFQNARVLALAAEYEHQLVDLGLVPDQALKTRRLLLFGAVAGPLLAISVTKMIVALDRGHHNIGFLVLLSIVSLVVIFKVCTPFRTQAGLRAVTHVKDLFRGLNSRGKSLRLHAPTNELVLLAAVFGVTALPDSVVGILKPMKLYRDTAAGSSCGSSCGGSTSSCGGGGCGGGGCGGCGS